MRRGWTPHINRNDVAGAARAGRMHSPHAEPVLSARRGGKENTGAWNPALRPGILEVLTARGFENVRVGSCDGTPTEAYGAFLIHVWCFYPGSFRPGTQLNRVTCLPGALNAGQLRPNAEDSPIQHAGHRHLELRLWAMIDFLAGGCFARSCLHLDCIGCPPSYRTP